MAEVVDFKSKKLEKEQELFDSIIDQFIEDQIWMNELTLQAAGEVINYLYENGIDVEDEPNSIKEIFLMLEAINGIIHRVEGSNHEIHEITNEMFEGLNDPAAVMKRFLHGKNNG